ncbi:surface-adhesin E family protein [Variovorax sp. PAMC 28711]|uniref:surface-adhesin E family protein n=1 Tax=Variovorax sp. PAMC 28711 TaxID=1795631 RepID=UPI00078E1196|nr:surface-adhesin E family protein [Variovorax sp. PAMC 28711]AMM26007.1 hypothetical protein AX767_17850 [Variovorax sp. PAMC 28711]
MKSWMAVLCLGGCMGAPAHAQGEWFTVMGDAADGSVDTVQVDPVAVSVEGRSKTMNVRVNRAASRLNWDDVPYRSFESRVVFDCQARRADYVQVRYYTQALWGGEAAVETEYRGDPRPMLLRDMVPNPTSRLLRAACPTKAR